MRRKRAAPHWERRAGREREGKRKERYGVRVENKGKKRDCYKRELTLARPKSHVKNVKYCCFRLRNKKKMEKNVNGKTRHPKIPHRKKKVRERAGEILSAKETGWNKRSGQAACRVKERARTGNWLKEKGKGGTVSRLAGGKNQGEKEKLHKLIQQ